MTAAPPFLTRVRIRNYRSIAACDVELGSLAFLVGPNGSGKSNFLDAIRFVADALDTKLDHALRARGGISEVRRRSRGRPNNFAIRLDFRIPDGREGHYAFQVVARDHGGFAVKAEQCAVINPHTGERDWFKNSDKADAARSSLKVAVPPVAHDRLYLVAISAIEPFRNVYDALVRMRFYNLNPGIIREPQEPDPGDFLKHDGGNLASVLADLRTVHPDTMKRIEQYLRFVVPGTRSAKRIPYGTRETIEFSQGSWTFPAASMSDGTLRALGILTALLQDSDGPPTLIAMEEPEIALHPAALAALIDAFQDAREQTQVLVTTHSTDLLHSEEVRVDELLAVSAESGATVVGPVDEGSRKTLADRLFTAGELLGANDLEPTDESARMPDIKEFFTL